MIRLATLNTIGGKDKTQKLDQAIKGIQQEYINILFLRENYTSGADQHAKIRELAKTLGMTYIYTSIKNGSHSDAKKQKQLLTSLAIFTGEHAWMLNSGRLPSKEGGGREHQAQFGIIRSENNCLAVLNTQFDEKDGEPEQQLTSLLHRTIPCKQFCSFAAENNIHSMLCNHFCALVLNSNIHTLVSENTLTALIEKKGMTLSHPVYEKDDDSSLIIITPRIQPLASIKLGRISQLGESCGRITDLEITRLSKEKRSSRYLPISMYERWTGSRGSNMTVTS